MNQVLLVNDNDEILDRTAAMLVDMGWEVYVAQGDELVFEATVARRPDLLIVDIEMRAGVGFEAISTARMLFKDLFIIAVTRGDNQEIWPEVAKHCGADTYVIGPVSLSKLKSSIDRGVQSGQISIEEPPPDGRREP